MLVLCRRVDGFFSVRVFFKNKNREAAKRFAENIKKQKELVEKGKGKIITIVNSDIGFTSNIIEPEELPKQIQKVSQTPEVKEIPIVTEKKHKYTREEFKKLSAAAFSIPSLSSTLPSVVATPTPAPKPKPKPRATIVETPIPDSPPQLSDKISDPDKFFKLGSNKK